MKNELQNNTKFGEIMNEAKRYFVQGDRLLLAQRAGVSRATISHYLHGRISLPRQEVIDVIVALANERRNSFSSAKAKLFNQ